MRPLAAHYATLEDHPLLAVVVLCAVVQIASAWLQNRPLDAPNETTSFARTLVHEGTYAGASWEYLAGSRREGRLALFHLPGGPLYVAAGLATLPPRLHRFIQTPVMMLLVWAAASLAGSLAGNRAALAAGAIAALNPFVVVHGPVWDDMMLGAALDWSLVALLLTALQTGHRPGWRTLGALAGLAGAAVLTRSQSAPVVLCIAAYLTLSPLTTPLRRGSVVILLAVVVALSGWGYRNYAAVGEFRLTATNGGITVWGSVYPHALDGLALGQTTYANDQFMQADYARTESMSEVDADRYFIARAFEHVLYHPLQVTGIAVRKLAVTFLGVRPELAWSSARNLVGGAWSILVLVGGFAGIVLLWRRRAEPSVRLFLVVVFWIAAVTIALGVLGPAGYRYRLELEVGLWVAAGVWLAVWRTGRTDR